MCVPTLNWELHTHTHTQTKWATWKEAAGLSERGNKRVRKAETNINLSSKKYIYNLTYISIFRLKHESLTQPSTTCSSLDTLVKRSFRSITGPLLHMRLGSGSVLAANKSLLWNASSFSFSFSIGLKLNYLEMMYDFFISEWKRGIWHYCHSSADKKYIYYGSWNLYHHLIRTLSDLIGVTEALLV